MIITYLSLSIVKKLSRKKTNLHIRNLHKKKNHYHYHYHYHIYAHNYDKNIL